MSSLQREIEDFLIAEAGLGLSNICTYLERVLVGTTADVVIPRQDLVDVVANLERIAVLASGLGRKLADDPAAAAGLEEVLRTLLCRTASRPGPT